MLAVGLRQCNFRAFNVEARTRRGGDDDGGIGDVGSDGGGGKSWIPKKASNAFEAFEVVFMELWTWTRCLLLCHRSVIWLRIWVRKITRTAAGRYRAWVWPRRSRFHFLVFCLRRSFQKSRTILFFPRLCPFLLTPRDLFWRFSTSFLSPLFPSSFVISRETQSETFSLHLAAHRHARCSRSNVEVACAPMCTALACMQYIIKTLLCRKYFEMPDPIFIYSLTYPFESRRDDFFCVYMYQRSVYSWFYLNLINRNFFFMPPFVPFCFMYRDIISVPCCFPCYQIFSKFFINCYKDKCWN